MTKGKPWPVEDERRLRDLVNAGCDFKEIVDSFGGKYTKNAVYLKMSDLDLEKPNTKTQDAAASSKGARLIRRKELPSMEESMHTLIAASDAMEAPDLTRTDLIRLRSVIQAQIAYQPQFPKYVNYKELEAEVAELKEKLASNNTTKGNTDS